MIDVSVRFGGTAVKHPLAAFGFHFVARWRLPLSKPRKTPDLSGGPIGSQGTLRLWAAGAGMLLGELEHSLMEAAWAMKRPATARELHARVVKKRDIEYITAVTVLNRLVSAKRLMTREKVDELYHYAPTFGRDEFLQRASRQVMERVLGLGTDAVAASMVDVLADRDPEKLAELARLVRKKLRDKGSK